MYEDPSRWSLTFQTYVQLTMLETHAKKQVGLFFLLYTDFLPTVKGE